MVDQAPNNLGTPTQETTNDRWILQQLNNQSSDLARQTVAMENLAETVKEMSNDLKEVNKSVTRIQLLIAFGSGILVFGGIIFSAIAWFVDKRFDQIIQAVS